MLEKGLHVEAIVENSLHNMVVIGKLSLSNIEGLVWKDAMLKGHKFVSNSCRERSIQDRTLEHL